MKFGSFAVLMQMKSRGGLRELLKQTKKKPFLLLKGCGGVSIPGSAINPVEMPVSAAGYWGHGGFGQRLDLKILRCFPNLMIPDPPG